MILVAPFVPIAVPVSSAAGDEEMRDSRNVSEFEAAQNPVLGGAPEVKIKTTERIRETKTRAQSPATCSVVRRFVAELAQLMTHIMLRFMKKALGSLPKIVCDHTEIKMKRDTTPMRVLLVVDSSTGYLGATDVDQKGGNSGFVAKWMAEWLESTGYARMKVQSDAEQSIEHLLKAVKSICAADLIVQRAPVKSHHSQGHVERAVRLVENQYRSLLFDVQERTTVEIDPISAASACMDTETCSLASQQVSATQRTFGRLTGSPYRSPILPLFAMVECLIPSDRKPGGVLVVKKGTPRTFRSMWVGRTEESDEHLVVNEIGHVVRARTIRRCVENENSGSDVIKLNATPSYLKPDGDDVQVRERWTPTPGCRACESAHANKHLVRCEARRHEYRLKYGRIHLWQRKEFTMSRR